MLGGWVTAQTEAAGCLRLVLHSPTVLGVLGRSRGCS
jgi:hypothetical protein